MRNAVVLLMSLWCSAAWAQHIESTSKLSVVELFTSEGCSSCPPADEWLNATFPRADAVAVAYHVDYWNQLGWPDPFSSAASTDRQRHMAERDGGRVYTPEVAIDGHELSRGSLGDALARRAPTSTKVTLKVTRTDGTLHVEAKSSDTSLRVRVVLVESGLSVSVPRGENGGRVLRHDHVARRVLEGDGAVDGNIQLAAAWSRARLGVVALAEDRRTGDIRQAVFLSELD